MSALLSTSMTCSTRSSLERVLFMIAGTVAVVSALLVAFVSPWFALLTAFAGINQLLFAAVGDCPMSLVLRRFAGLQPTSSLRS